MQQSTRRLRRKLWAVNCDQITHQHHHRAVYVSNHCNIIEHCRSIAHLIDIISLFAYSSNNNAGARMIVVSVAEKMGGRRRVVWSVWCRSSVRCFLRSTVYSLWISSRVRKFSKKGPHLSRKRHTGVTPMIGLRQACLPAIDMKGLQWEYLLYSGSRIPQDHSNLEKRLQWG